MKHNSTQEKLNLNNNSFSPHIPRYGWLSQELLLRDQFIYTERIPCILCMYQAVCRFFSLICINAPPKCIPKMHLAAFYFSCTHVSARDLTENVKPEILRGVLFSANILTTVCTHDNRELTLVYMPMLSTYMLNSNQLLVYRFNTL